MYDPADVAVTFEQAEGGALLCGGDICNVRVAMRTGFFGLVLTAIALVLRPTATWPPTGCVDHKLLYACGGATA
jgi:hypothetical protein